MKIKIISVLFYHLFLASTVWAQTNINHYKSKAKKSFRKMDYNTSIFYYQKLDSLRPDMPEIKYNLGICYLNSNYKSKALPYLEFAKAKNLPNPTLNFMLGQAYHHALQFDKAIDCFETFLKELNNDTLHEAGTIKDTKRRIEICKHAKSLVADSIPIEIKNLGKNINSEYDEYVPIVSADQSKMFFTSRRIHHTNLKLSHDGKHYEEIYEVHKNSCGEWGNATNAGHPINGLQHDACIGITADGLNLYLYRTSRFNHHRGHILISALKNNCWQTPTKLGTEIDSKKSWECSISISSDKHRLYFSSDKPGGYGGLDIWYCELGTDNQWGKAINAGSSINTKYDEDCPFIHFDNKTLFFSSNGHNTMGGFDVFSCMMNDTNTFSEPQNLGYPINSTEDDMYFIYSANGANGYMSKSNREDSHGERDLYIVNRLNHSTKLIALRCEVIDSKTNNPIDATVTVKDIATNKIIGNYCSTTGHCMLTLQFGKKYSFQFESENHKYEDEIVQINNPSAIFSDHITFRLIKNDSTQSLTLKN